LGLKIFFIVCPFLEKKYINKRMNRTTLVSKLSKQMPILAGTPSFAVWSRNYDEGWDG